MADTVSNNDRLIIQPDVITESGTTDAVDGALVEKGAEGQAQIEAASVTAYKSEADEDGYLSLDFDDEETQDGEVDETEYDISEFKLAFSKNEDAAFILEAIGEEDFFNELDKNNDGKITIDELQEINNEIKSLEDLTLKDILKFAEKMGLPVPDEEDLEDIDLSESVFDSEIIEKLKDGGFEEEIKLTDDETPTEETNVETPAADTTVQTPAYTPMYAGSSGGSGGGYYGGGGTSRANTPNVDANKGEVPEENKSLDELKNSVRPEKEKTLNTAKDNLAALANDGGDLAQYKEAMETAFENYSNAVENADGELSAALNAKHEEINKQEKLISQKEADIANQECTISECEANLSNLNASRAALVQNKNQLTALNSSDIEDSKRAQLTAAIGSLTSQIEELDRQIENAETKLDTAKEELKDMQTGKEDSLDSLQEQLKTLQSDEEGQLGDIQNKINALMENNPEIKECFDTYNTQKEIYEGKKAELTSAAQQELKTAQDEIIKTDKLINTKQTEETNKQYSTKKFTQADLFLEDGAKLSIQEINDGTSVPYLLIGPENADPNEELPVLVYLHGRGQVGTSLANLQNHQYDPAVFMQEWDLNNFNGYIICPVLDYGSWNTPHGEQCVRNVYNNFAATHKVDEDKVAVAGASLGAQGALYMANAMSDVFKKAAAFSPYNPGNIGKGMNIPTKAFVGSNDDRNSINFANGTLRGMIGDENYYVLNGKTHDQCPAAGFNIDSDGNGRSDILEWLFGDE